MSKAEAGDEPAATGAVVLMTAAEFAATTEQRVLEQGFDVSIDCGTEDVPLEAGASRACVAVYRGEGSVSQLTVTIATVTGAEFELSVIGLGDPVGEYDR